MKELCVIQGEASAWCVLLGPAWTASTQQSQPKDLRNGKI